MYDGITLAGAQGRRGVSRNVRPSSTYARPAQSCPRPWLYPARLQGPTAKLSTRSTTGPTTAKPTSTTSPWPAPKTTATSSPAAGPPENYLRPDEDDAD